MKSFSKGTLRGLVFCALSVASTTGCAANVDDAEEETTATTGEQVTLSGWNRWYAGEPDLVLAPSSSNFCFLTEVLGRFRTANDRVQIKDVGGNWVLTGGAPSSSLKYGAAAACIAKSNPNKKIWQWPDPNLPPGDLSPNVLHSWSTSACYLTGLSGAFGFVTNGVNQVRTRNGGNGAWVLDAITDATNSTSIKAYAACVSGVSLIGTQNVIIGEGQAYDPNLPGTEVGPDACFLTRVGGALGINFLPPPLPAPYPEIRISHYRPEPSPAWTWQMTVKTVNLDVTGGIRCIR